MFPACLNNMLVVIKEAIDFFENNCTINSHDDLFNVKVILNELLVNAITHGCKCDENKIVTLNCEIKEDGTLVLKIRDGGTGYDYCNILKQEFHDVFSFDSNMKECGRGIIIVKSLCEKISFNKEGNEIEVIVKI